MIFEAVLAAALNFSGAPPQAGSGGSVDFPPKAAASGCTAATNFLARVTTTYSTAYTTMICGMVTDGTWSKFDVVYVLATDTSATALTNLVSSSFPLTNVGATFTANQGYFAVSGGAGHVTSTYNLSTGTNYVQNSAALLGWGIGMTTATGAPIVGGSGSGAHSYLYSYDNSLNLDGRLNGTVDVLVSVANGNTMSAIDRSSSSTVTLFRAGSQVTQSTSNTSQAADSETMDILGYFYGHIGDPLKGVAFVAASSSLGSSNETSVYNRVHTFLHTINSGTFP